MINEMTLISLCPFNVTRSLCCLLFILSYVLFTSSIPINKDQSSMTTYVLTNNNDAIDFWDPTKIAEAIANDQNIINYDNSDSNDLLSFNRLKRSPLNPIGTDDEIRQARSHLPTPSRDYFNKLGVPMGKNVRMVADVDRESTHIKPANISITPWKHYGKLLFRTPEGLGTCTAAFLDERVLLTAAHCVKSFDWHSDFHFLHGYNSLSDKGRPIQIQNVLVPKRYDRFHDSWYGDLRFDYAILTTEQSSTNGCLGLKTGDVHGTILSAGYSSIYGEERLVYTQGQKGLEEFRMINVPSNELGESSSGGPWLTEESGRYFIVGLNSHARPGIPGMFSPKLDSLTAELYRSALAIVKGIRGTDLKPEDPFDIEPGDQVAEIGGQHQSVHQSIIQQSVSSNQSNDNRSFRCNQMSCELNCGSSYQYSCINGVESCHCAG